MRRETLAHGWMHARRTAGALARLLRWIGLHELGILLAVALAATGIWVFAEVAGEVGEGETREIDRAVLLALRTPGDPADPLGPGWVEEGVRDLTALGSVMVLALVVAFAAGHLALSGKRHSAMLLIATAVSGALVSTALKEIFERPRPDLVAHGARVITHSFPSGHSLMSAVIYLTVGALLARFQPKLRLKAYLLLSAFAASFIVGASRLYLGVHWPSDVVAGWAAGAAWAAACWGLALRLQRKGKVEQPGETSPPSPHDDATAPA